MHFKSALGLEYRPALTICAFVAKVVFDLTPNKSFILALAYSSLHRGLLLRQQTFGSQMAFV